MDKISKLNNFFQTIGDTSRLRIIQFIGNEKRAVSEIVKATNLSQPLVSHHLRILKKSDILETERKGPFVFYKLKNISLLEILDRFAEIAPDIISDQCEMPMFCRAMWKNKFRKTK